jgi:hypothetical protein
VVPATTAGPEGRSDAELADLVRAQRARAAALGWTAAEILFVVILVLAGGLGALLWSATRGAAALLAVIAAASLALATVARGRARDANATARGHLDAAWATVAREAGPKEGDPHHEHGARPEEVPPGYEHADLDAARRAP